jgi:hypothetical protein
VRSPVTEDAEYGQASAPGHGAAVAVAGSAKSAARITMSRRGIKGSQPEPDAGVAVGSYCFRRRSDEAISIMRALDTLRPIVFEIQ